MKVGDSVSWNTPQGRTHGKVVARKTARFSFEGQTFNAGQDEPYAIVESDKSGKRAAHKESSLDRQ